MFQLIWNVPWLYVQYFYTVFIVLRFTGKSATQEAMQDVAALAKYPSMIDCYCGCVLRLFLIIQNASCAVTFAVYYVACVARNLTEC